MVRIKSETLRLGLGKKPKWSSLDSLMEGYRFSVVLKQEKFSQQNVDYMW